MLFGISLAVWLKSIITATTFSTLGALFGIFLKDYFFSRSFERWKQKRMLESLHQRFGDPLLLAANELASRISEVLDHYPTVYLRKIVLTVRPDRQMENSINDPYFQHYKLISTAYRLNAFLGWLELYRQEITFLHPGNSKSSMKLERIIDDIRCALADGQINKAANWHEWRDTMIFREELRAIGESMIESRGTIRTVIGYGRFCELIESDASCSTKRWYSVVLNFLLDLELERQDFRQIRLKRLAVHLVELITLLGKAPSEYLLSATDKLRLELEDSLNS